MPYAPVVPGSSAIIHACIKFPVVVVILGLAIALPSLGLLSEPVNCTDTMITFTFDGGHQSTITKAYPILSKYGYTGTAFVPTDSINVFGHMSSGQLLVLQNAGWEIGSNTVTYRDLTTLDDAELDNEVSESKSFLERNGFNIWGIASPYGKYDQRVIDQISSQYVYHRTSDSGLNDIPLGDPSYAYEIKAVRVTSGTSVQEVKDWIIRAKQEGKWLVLIFYKIDEQGEDSWSSANLEEVVKFAKENDFVGLWRERLLLASSTFKR